MLTCTSTQATKPPSKVVTDIFAVPGETAVTTPVALTVATKGLLLAHLTRRIVALAGSIVAVIVRVVPVVLVVMATTPGGVVMPVTGIAGTGTVTTAVASCVPFCVVATIEAVPGEIPVTTPVALTCATRGLRLAQTTERLVALWGDTKADKVPLAPIVKFRVVGVTVMLAGATKRAATSTTACAVKLPS